MDAAAAAAAAAVAASIVPVHNFKILLLLRPFSYRLL